MNFYQATPPEHHPQRPRDPALPPSSKEKGVRFPHLAGKRPPYLLPTPIFLPGHRIT